MIYEKTKVYVNPKSGSIRVTGWADMIDAQGNIIETVRNIKFCGCGKAETYICDGSHKEKI